MLREDNGMKKKKNSDVTFTKMKSPILFVLAGPNGAGKTTSAKVLLKEVVESHTFVNADIIAEKISPGNPAAANIRAARMMLKKINQLRKKKKTFAIETTLTTISYAKLFKEMQEEGYTIYMIYVFLNAVELSIKRVAERVANGGHNIPEETIRRRFPKGLKNLKEIFIPISDIWKVYDNSNGEFDLIAEGDKVFGRKIYKSEICKTIFLR